MKTILITGSTDGIGLETAKLLSQKGHHILLHGRSPEKLKNAEALLASDKVTTFLADLSKREQVVELAEKVDREHPELDVLINNAGVYKVPQPRTLGGRDLRFVVNTIAPYYLSLALSKTLGTAGRVISLSSAAQAPVNMEALFGQLSLGDGEAYAQSKLALTMWSRQLALSWGQDGPTMVSVNPGSLLGSKMVKEAYGMDGGDLRKGADILARAALSEEFASASGSYFDNDSGRFAHPHRDALTLEKAEAVTRAVDEISQLGVW